MFADLESEIIRLLRANLSPGLLPEARVQSGPVADPPASQFPSVAFTASGFEVLPDDDSSPPHGVKLLIEDSFPAGAETNFDLTRSPLEPLRGVEVAPSTGPAVLLRERDDYSVDYVNGVVRLRRPPEGDLSVDYFTHQALRIVAATRLKLSCRLEVWGNADPAATDGLTAVATTALGAIQANAPNLDGFVSQGHDIPDSGRTVLGVRRALFLFEILEPKEGTQTAASKWQIEFEAKAWMILVPRDDEIGIMRQIATSLAWDEALARRVLSEFPPLLERPVTDVQSVGAVTAAQLAALNIETVGQLAAASPQGIAAIDNAVGRARTIQGQAEAAIRGIVLAGPKIDDLPAFLALLLNAVDNAALTALDIPAATASEILAAIAALLAEFSATDLRFSDMFAI